MPSVRLFQHVDNVKDEETAQTALPQLTELEGHQFSLDNLIISAKPKAVRAADFNGFATDGRGVDKAGNETLFQTMLFVPKEGDYYLVTCRGPRTIRKRRLLIAPDFQLFEITRRLFHLQITTRAPGKGGVRSSNSSLPRQGK